MKTIGIIILGVATLTSGLWANEALQLHPDNPHYFRWRGRPTVLITSGEHYGAVLNRDFDYVKYLDTLAKDKLNLTRTFSGGAYVEPQGAFNIARNTLAPAAGRLIAPWARSDQPGYAGGGNKFDLSRWDDAYFARLRDFVRQASERGIVVEMNLFCPMYEEKQWQLSPFNAINNVNNVGHVDRLDIYTLGKHGGLLEIEERMTRKIVAELAEFDNVYYEVTNEPYIRGVPKDWENHMVDVISEAQQDHANQKLISLNIANNSAKGARASSASFDLQFPLCDATGDRDHELRAEQSDRRQRNRFPRHGRHGLPYRGLGVSARRWRTVQQSGLFVYRGARRWIVRVPEDAARWRKCRVSPSDASIGRILP